MPALLSFRPVHTRGQCRSCLHTIRVDERSRWVHDRGGQPKCTSLSHLSPFAEPALSSIVEPLAG